MGWPGSGFTIASCSAYSTTNGVMMPEVSAGSNQVGARAKCTAQVSWPSGAAWPGGAPAAGRASSSNVTRSRRTSLIAPASFRRPYDSLPLRCRPASCSRSTRGRPARRHSSSTPKAPCARAATRKSRSTIRGRAGWSTIPRISGRPSSARRRAARGQLAFGTVDTWLLWKLTRGRVHATDVSNASRTLCLNLASVDWDDRMCALLDVPPEVLPTLVDSSGPCAETADLGWLPRGVPIAGIAGDQQAALFGQACFQPGEAKNTYGTGRFALLNTGDRPVVSSHGLLTTLAWRIGGRTTYALEGAVFVAGAAVQWLRDGLGIIANAAETDALARSVPDAGGVYFVPAFVGLGAPYWDQHARGTILGLTRGTTRAHLARAALEAIAFQSRDVLEAMAADAKATLPRLRVDGGAVANHFLCQFQADVLDAPVDRPAG